jgi:transcriptional regulator
MPMLYVPEAFAERDSRTLLDFVAAHPFATLISPDLSDPAITHLPLLLDREPREHGKLRGHVARANPHWRVFAERPQVVAVFHGPHAYVSPAWYAHHPSVPTWNYAVVHVHGRARILAERGALEALIRALVEEHERGRQNRWQAALPKEYWDDMLTGIVGFEIEIERMTGKFKLSQNRPVDDMHRVIDALASGGAEPRAVAELMRVQAPRS